MNFLRTGKNSFWHAVMVIVFLGISPWTNAGYEGHEEAKKLIKDMVSKHGFDEAALVKLFSAAEKKDKILTAIAKPAEHVLEWSEYQDIFLTEKRIAEGKAFMQVNAKALADAEAKYGVPARIIAAIIGVETFYGTRKGTWRIIDALSTLAFDYPPRAKFFRGELEHFLLLAREQGFDPLTLEGSYAGAMGFGQFIPSSYRHYAVDFDGDKTADLFHNVNDAIGSVANYFAEHKWKYGEPVTFPLTLTGESWKPLVATKLKPIHKVSDLQAAGVPIPEGVKADADARLQRLLGKNGEEYWLTLHNFYVITRYNLSHMYAMAVYQLSEKLAQP